MEHDCPCDDLVDWKAMVDTFRAEQERWHNDLWRRIDFLARRVRVLEDSADEKGE